MADDDLSIDLDIRTDAVFSDGTPVDADAVVASLEYLKAGARSGEAYVNAKGFEKVDDDTVRIALTHRDDTILYLMGLGRSYVMPPASIEAGTLGSDPIGSGPYVLDSDTSVAGAEYHFTKTEDHWDAKTYPFAELAIYPITDATARHNAMLSGQINVQYGDVANLDQAEQQGWNTAQRVSGWAGLAITDHTGAKSEPLGTLEVRQALNYAFDGAAVLAAVGSGAGVATNQVFPDGGDINDPELNDAYAFNIDKAKELLADAGYPDGFDISMPMSPIFEMWKPSAEQALNELGITVTWDNMQMPDYQLNAPNYPMFISFLAMDGNDVATVSRQLTSVQWFNPEPDYAKNEVIAPLVEKVQTERGDAQTAAIKGAQRGPRRPGLVVGLVPGEQHLLHGARHPAAARRGDDVPDAAVHHAGLNARRGGRHAAAPAPLPSSSPSRGPHAPLHGEAGAVRHPPARRGLDRHVLPRPPRDQRPDRLAPRDHGESRAARGAGGEDRTRPPLIVQFWDWFSHAVLLDFGVSWRNFQPVGAQLAVKVPVTLSVVTLATLITAVIGVAFGMITGLRPGTWFDRIIKGISVVLFALPGFWVSLVLVMWLAVQLKWFPAVGYVPPTQSVEGWLRSITLPAISLALGGIVAVSEQLRNAVIAQSRQDWVRTLRSRGLSAARVNLHILRNASPAALTVIALMFVGLLSGAIVVEQIFSLPGLGQLTNQSSQNGDIPMLLGITVVSIVFVVLINLLLDLVLGWINPKVRVA